MPKRRPLPVSEMRAKGSAQGYAIGKRLREP
jgi:hypothetical protein